MARIIHWFRNDLRVNDNPALNAALNSGHAVLPVFVLDERLWKTDSWGHTKTGSFRTQFLLESLEDLKNKLEAEGAGLLIRIGKPEDILPTLASEWDCQAISAQAEYTREEMDVESALARKYSLKLMHGSTLYHPDDIPFELEDIPDIFTQFRKACEKKAVVRQISPLPDHGSWVDFQSDSIPKAEDFGLSVSSQDERRVMHFKGGSTAAFERIQHYFWNSESLSHYKKTRNGLIGADYSAKLSPWLANGSLSPRQIYWEVLKYEQKVVKNQSTYWLVFELIWRDYFKYVAMKYGDRIFWPGGIKAAGKKWLTNADRFQKWKSGQTGDAFVDANMRELFHTGWMSNRGRQNVASYLVHDMGMDWRMGASWFESQLLDYDPCSNYGNWIYVAGVGNDPRENRKFNTQRQAEMYDGDGEFREIWLGA